jgi:chromosome segregation protein
MTAPPFTIWSSPAVERLFGVTMQEKGVSQLVSVDLQTAERFREAG